MNTPPNWRDDFTPRDLKEIEFAQTYAQEFAHGTDGHNRLLIIARLATLLDKLPRPPEETPQTKR